MRVRSQTVAPMSFRVSTSADRRRVQPSALAAAGDLAGAVAALGSVEHEKFVFESEAVSKAIAAAGAYDLLIPYAEALLGYFDEVAGYTGVRQMMNELVLRSAEQPLTAWAQTTLALGRFLTFWLRHHPAEPVLLNQLGVCLYELNDPSTASKLFAAAMKLMPGLDVAARNKGAADAHSRTQVRQAAAQLPAAVRVGARELRKDAESILRQARPTDGLTISLVMIVKNEEADLPECLESVAGFVDEMVVVDTGSTDRTVEIAESFGAKVVRFEWTGSFADARNISLEHATGDWCLWLDADERIHEGDAPRLRELARMTWHETFQMLETNFTTSEESGGAGQTHLTKRMWRNRPWYRFEGIIHEQLSQSFPSHLPERNLLPGVRIDHYGYMKERRFERGKIERNIKLLEQELAESPSPFTYYNLGAEYSFLEDYAKARGYYEQALEGLRQIPDWTDPGKYQITPLLLVRLAAALRFTEPAAARTHIAEALEVYPDHTDLVFELALLEHQEGNIDECLDALEHCLELGDADPRYCPTTGCGTTFALALISEIERERHNFLRSAEYRLRSLQEFPEFTPAAHAYVELRLAGGIAPEEVEQEIDDALSEKTTAACMWTATAFYERGYPEIAIRWYEKALELAPAHALSLVGLGDVLTALRDYGRADEILAQAAELPTIAPVAIRARILVKILLGDLEAAAELTTELHAADPASATAYAAWLKQLAGDRPAPLTVPAAAFTAKLLEGLARLQEFAMFEQLLPVLRESVAAIDFARLLGTVFSRTGFPQLALEQWLAVVQEAPEDADALYGVARSAVQLVEQGAAAGFGYAEAADFLRACLAQNPDHQAAKALLALIEPVATA